MAKDTNDFEILQRRLDLIIHLLCMLVDTSKVPAITEQVALLANHGLVPAEIGKIIGREANYVSAVTKSRKRNTRRGVTK